MSTLKVVRALIGLLTALAMTAGGGPPASSVRVAGPERVTTAAAVSAHGWQAAPVVVVAPADGFAAAVAAGSLLRAFDAPLLLARPGGMGPVVAEVERLAAERAFVVGPVADEAKTALTDLGVAVTHVTGSDPAALAAAASRAAGPSPTRHAVLAAGHDYPDALAAATLLHPGEPLLLTTRDALPAATGAALEGVTHVTVVGGPAAVSGEVTDALGDRGVTVQRVAGPDRYGTALAVATRRPGNGIVLAAGRDFPDALAAGALAAHRGDALLLTPWLRLPDDVAGRLAGRPVTIVGGTRAVGEQPGRAALAAAAGQPLPGPHAAAGPLPPAVRDAMTGVSWRPGCPVGLDELALLEVDHHDFDGQVRRGRLVVHTSVAGDVLQAFRALFDTGFPLQEVELVDAYGADDDASMAANNTSAFNCRVVAGTTRWSQHAYGRAVDLNPVQNPWVRDDAVEPPAGREYLDRTDVRTGMVVRPGPAVAAFETIGWGWGGDWRSSKDYQHFSATGS